MKMASRLIDLISINTNCTCSTFSFNQQKQICTYSMLFCLPLAIGLHDYKTYNAVLYDFGMLSFRGFSEITGLHVLLKFSYGPCTRKPFAGKVMSAVLSLFLLHDFLLSSVSLCLCFAFVCKHYISLSTTKSDTVLYCSS